MATADPNRAKDRESLLICNYIEQWYVFIYFKFVLSSPLIKFSGCQVRTIIILVISKFNN